MRKVLFSSAEKEDGERANGTVFGQARDICLFARRRPRPGCRHTPSGRMGRLSVCLRF